MKAYIRSTGAISAQKTFGEIAFPGERITHKGIRWNAVEPDYAKIIDPKLIRRMSRIIRMGVAAATECLGNAGLQAVDAIVTGTAYGCLQDTEIFLKKMIENKEELLTPTSFIQSTHNTVGAQIALMLHCHGYNNTYVHRGFSFENAVLDACLLLEENEANHVLVGGIDEITDISHQLLTRLGLYKRKPVGDDNLFSQDSKGTIAGEGAIFFLLGKAQETERALCLDAVSTLYKPADQAEIENAIQLLLREQGVTLSEIDLVITGENGDPANDAVYKRLGRSIFQEKPRIPFKQLCGEYPTASAFALWLAVRIIETGAIPGWIREGTGMLKKTPKKILIYNHYQRTHHSFFLVSAC